MKKLIIFLATFLFGLNIKVVNLHIDIPDARYVDSIKKVNFSKDVAIIDSSLMPYVINHHLKIIGGFGHKENYILTRAHFDKVKTIANANFESKIFLSTLPFRFRYVNATLDDFLNNKVDAIVVHKQYNIDNSIKLIDLKIFGIEFNKFLVVTSDKFAKKHKKELIKLKDKLSLMYPNEDEDVYKSLMLSAVYLNKSVVYHKYLFYDMQQIRNFIKVIVTPNWPPFDIYDGKLHGIGIDLWEKIAKKANLNYIYMLQPKWSELLYDIKEKVADLTPNTSYTKDRSKFAIFTKPYISFPLAVVCRSDFEGDFNDIKSLAVGKNFTAYKMMKSHYPDMNYVFTKNTFEALNLVKNNKADCAVDIMPVIMYIINKQNMHNLKIVYKTPFKFKLQIMLRKGLEDIRDRLNIAIDALTPTEKQAILNKYLGKLVIENKISHNNWFYAVILVLIIILIYLFFNVKKFKTKSQTDLLTGIYNRGTIEKKIKEIIKNEDGAIIFFDIDHFKNVNDTYGHEKGDEVLKMLAKLISENIRENDLFGRWGGEEFIIVLPKANYEIVLNKAEKLRSIVENYDFNGLKITSSFGVTHFNKGEDFDEVINRSDIALYQAKNNGRNQVKGEL